MNVTTTVHDSIVEQLREELSRKGVSVTIEELKNNPKVAEWFSNVFSEADSGEEYGLSGLIYSELHVLSETSNDLDEQLGY